jgi:ornithine carbamoyltransferase
MEFEPRRVLVVVATNPAESPRAIEALRMSVGIAVMDHRVKVLLRKPEAYPGHREAVRYLETLRELGAEVSSSEDPTEAARDADVVIRWGA